MIINHTFGHFSIEILLFSIWFSALRNCTQLPRKGVLYVLLKYQEYSNSGYYMHVIHLDTLSNTSLWGISASLLTCKMSIYFRQRNKEVLKCRAGPKANNNNKRHSVHIMSYGGVRGIWYFSTSVCNLATIHLLSYPSQVFINASVVVYWSPIWVSGTFSGSILDSSMSVRHTVTWAEWIAPDS